MPRRRPKSKRQAVSDIYSWTEQDTVMAGMPDPMQEHEDIAPPEIIAMFEQSFYHELVKDKEFWDEREDRLVPPIDTDPEPSPYDGDNLTNLLQDDMNIAGRAMYVLGMSLVYLLIVMPIHVGLWIYNTLRRHYYERRSMGSDQDGE